MASLNHHKHIDKLKHIYLYICLTIITSGSLLIGYWSLFPGEIIEFNKQVTVDKKEYRPGDRIVYDLSYCKKVNMTGTVYRSLLNGTRTSFTPMTNSLPVGCRQVKVNDLVIPEYSDEGLYHLEATVEYKVNPIRTFTASWKSEEFKIIK